MEFVSIVIPVHNRVRTTLDCIELIRKMNNDSSFEIIIVDNASDDETRELLPADPGLIYIRNEQNIGLSGAYNKASHRAQGDVLCFMHNDVFIHKPGWIQMIRDFIIGRTDAGVTGLYGAKMIRRDGSFRGKTIVHAIKDEPRIRRSHERVAVVDGLLMALKKKVFTEIGGYSEKFPIHFYDKDISMKCIQKGYMNYVLNIPFEHMVATTRRDVPGEQEERNSAGEKFSLKWKDILPADVSAWHEKLMYMLGRGR